MKFLKKLTLIFVCAVMLFSTACTGQQKVYNLFGGSYWLDVATAGGVSPVYEKCTYSISVVGSANDNLSLKITEASFTTELTATEYNQTKCYKFSTELVLKGAYEGGNKSVEVNDYQKSECYFLGLNDKLVPLYSTKTVSSITPLDMQSEYAFPRIEYTTVSEYDKQTGIASVKVTTGENNSKDYDYMAHEKQYEKYNANTFIDNECMMFLPRACQLEENFVQTFYTIDVLGQRLIPMRIGVSTQQPTAEISLAEYVVDGKPLASENNLKKFPVYNVLMQINSNFSGKALEFCYTTTENDNRNRLISFKQQLPVSLGDLKFTLKAINTTL